MSNWLDSMSLDHLQREFAKFIKCVSGSKSYLSGLSGRKVSARLGKPPLSGSLRRSPNALAPLIRDGSPVVRSGAPVSGSAHGRRGDESNAFRAALPGGFGPGCVHASNDHVLALKYGPRKCS